MIWILMIIAIVIAFNIGKYYTLWYLMTCDYKKFEQAVKRIIDFRKVREKNAEE